MPLKSVEYEHCPECGEKQASLVEYGVSCGGHYCAHKERVPGPRDVPRTIPLRTVIFVKNIQRCPLCKIPVLVSYQWETRTIQCHHCGENWDAQNAIVTSNVKYS